MTEPTNLNRFRKARQLAERKRQSDENAARFGRSKAERLLDAARSEKAARMLDGKYMDDEE